MTARIFGKLVLVVVVLIAVALAAIDFLASEMAENVYVAALRQEMLEKTRMIGVMNRPGLRELRPEAVRALAEAASGRVTVVDADGRVLQDSEADPAQMENHAHRPEVEAALSGRPGHSVRQSPTTGTNYLYVATPVDGMAVRLAMPLREVSGRSGSCGESWFCIRRRRLCRRYCWRCCLQGRSRGVWERSSTTLRRWLRATSGRGWM